MKRLFILLFVLILVLGFSLEAQADLFNRGTDIDGNRLIYDNDLNITWYDYSKSAANWNAQMVWASALTVTFGETIYDDWRLSSALDAPYSYGYDGSTTAGYNVTSSELGHLFYTELGNKGYRAINGTYPQPGWGLTNTRDFQHLQPNNYYLGTESDYPGYVWCFYAYFGDQGTCNNYDGAYAIAVRPGDVSIAVVPEPISSILFLTGGATLLGRKYVRG